MGRLKSSLFCADCKSHLADEMARAMDEEFRFPEMLVVYFLFRGFTRPYLEGYLYATWLITQCEDQAEAGVKEPEVRVDVHMTRTELTGFKQAIKDGTANVKTHHARERLYHLICLYFSLIRYRFPHHDHSLSRRIVERCLLTIKEDQNKENQSHDTAEAPTPTMENELDSICRAVEAAAEKVR